MRIKSDALRYVGVVLLLLVCPGMVRSQSWIRMDVSDSAKDKKYTEFVLQGKFLQAPQALMDKSPNIGLQCRAGRNGRMHGKLLTAVVNIGPSGEAGPSDNGEAKPDPGGFYVEYKLNGGEVQSGHWDNLQNYQQVGFGLKELTQILWGHTIPHKQDEGLPVGKFEITVQRYRNEKIVMYFDMPDPTEVSEMCGCTQFK